MTILAKRPLGPPPWPTADPFLFCVHHLDRYPAGNEQMGPDASLAGRNIGMDFEGVDGWRMYHGDVIPGFPRHPHRGFETVTLARQGLIDHADSLGATARFGHGDVQWMTAGGGVVHSEMFPLIDRSGPNTTELFQIWLNLPRADKMVDPYFTMLWADTIPQAAIAELGGQGSGRVTMIAGAIGEHAPPAPPPNSWASRDEADVAIWTVELDPGARLVAPAAREGTVRSWYFFRGDSMRIGEDELQGPTMVTTDHHEVELVAGPEGDRSADQGTQVLLLQGRPIAEPVAQYGPFVMNAPGEIRQAMLDYQRTQFGGWPWNDDAPVHDRDRGRFAIHADGRTEER